MKHSAILFFIFACLISNQSLYSQADHTQARDSLLQVLEESSGEEKIQALIQYSSTYIPNWDSVISIREEALQLATETGDSTLILETAFNTMNAYSYKDDPPSVIRIGESFVNYLDSSTDTLLIIRYLNVLGGFGYFTQGNIFRHVQYQQKAIDLIYRSPNWTQPASELVRNLCLGYLSLGRRRSASIQIEKVRTTVEKYNDSVAIAELMLWDGFQSFHEDETEKAFRFYQQAYDIGKSLGNVNVWTDAGEFLGQIYSVRGNLDSAFYYFDEAAPFKDAERDLHDLLHLEMLRGQTYLNANQPSKAFEIISPLRSTFDSLGNKIRVIQSGLTLGEIYHQLNQSQLGISILTDNLELARSSQYELGQIQSFEKLVKIYQELGQLEKVIQIKDSILHLKEKSFQTQQKDVEDQIILQEEYQERLLDQAKLETQNLDLQQKNRNRNAIILLSGICLLVILAFYLLIRRNLRSERQLTQSLDRKIEEQTNDLRNSLREIQEANEDLRKFAFIASHTFKSGVRTVKITTELIKRKLGEDSDSILPLLSHVDAAGTSMDEMLEGLTTYFSLRGTGGNQRPLSFSEVVQKSVERVRNEFPESLISVSSSHNPQVIGNPTELNELIYQVLRNCCQYVKPGSTPNVSLSVSLVHDTVELVITDTGIGIPLDYQQQIYEAFFRLHPEDEYPGPGIGLSIADRIAGRHQGQIQIVESSEQGTTWKITLPYFSPQR